MIFQVGDRVRLVRSVISSARYAVGHFQARGSECTVVDVYNGILRVRFDPEQLALVCNDEVEPVTQ